MGSRTATFSPATTLVAEVEQVQILPRRRGPWGQSIVFSCSRLQISWGGSDLSFFEKQQQNKSCFAPSLFSLFCYFFLVFSLFSLAPRLVSRPFCLFCLPFSPLPVCFLSPPKKQWVNFWKAPSMNSDIFISGLYFINFLVFGQFLGFTQWMSLIQHCWPPTSQTKICNLGKCPSFKVFQE